MSRIEPRAPDLPDLDGPHAEATPPEAPVEAATPAAATAPEEADRAPGDRLGRLFRTPTSRYFDALDRDAPLRARSQTDALGAALDVLTRADVPADVERKYAKQAGSPGGGRVLMLLDYTRGFDRSESDAQALRKGPMHYLTSKVVTPLLSHFRTVSGASLFPGDTTFAAPFRDSALFGANTNQTGHFLCAVDCGARLAHMERHPLERRAFELGLRGANALAGVKGVQPTVADWSRAGILGHELGGDDGTGFTGQMKLYAKLVGNGDPDGIRAHWDDGVAAVNRGDHAAAWRHIRAIAKAGEVPATAAEVEAARANPSPRLTSPEDERGGNSVADLALSLYGFAYGYRAAGTGFDSPAAARAELEAFLSAGGRDAAAVERAAAGIDR